MLRDRSAIGDALFMPSYQKKMERIRSLKLDKIVEQLEAKVAMLTFLQTSSHMEPALRARLSVPGLTRDDRLEIQRCLSYLTPDEP